MCFKSWPCSISFWTQNNFEVKNLEDLTFPTLGAFSPRPTIRMQSACRMHLCVQVPNVKSHWYSASLCWSSCCPSHEIRWCSLFWSKIRPPKCLRITSEVSRIVDPVTTAQKIKEKLNKIVVWHTYTRKAMV